MIVIGITGSIGCGKTYIANILKSMGFLVYNPDKWVSNLYKNKKFLQIIKKEFPLVFNEQYIFDKSALKNLVFNKNEKLKRLENIIHPILTKKLKKIININSQKTDLIFIDVALLFEIGWDKYCDFVIAADVDEKIQKERVIKRDNITEYMFYKIINNQMDKFIKNSKADFVINTNLPYGINKVQLINFIKEVL